MKVVEPWGYQDTYDCIQYTHTQYSHHSSHTHFNPFSFDGCCRGAKDFLFCGVLFDRFSPDYPITFQHMNSRRTHTSYPPPHCNNSQPPCPVPPWEQEQWLPADINNWETCCTHPVYYWPNDVCKQHNVSVRAKVFFSCLATIWKSKTASVRVRMGGYFLYSPVQETADTERQLQDGGR